jgi:uncharacterized protein (DUF1499 family)
MTMRIKEIPPRPNERLQVRYAVPTDPHRRTSLGRFNCVSSRAEKPSQRVNPILFQGDPASAWSRLRSVVASMKGARIAEEKEGYLHAEFRSAWFGFVDDMELRLTEAAERIDVRSASRSGYCDFGVNRRRVEEIRKRFAREP